ncbi:cathepsin O [Nilaparvata lugens]|uniref:cathepsin O n=1 Tax=Nilaparvata lugens TaxID=108931 RepID=UPI000B996D4C|nr:cathepsin O [Nilaparvata lugens]
MAWGEFVKKLAIFGLLCLVIPVNIDKTNTKEERLLFEAYIKKYNKHYKNNTEEYHTRLRHFRNALENIDKLNSQHGKGDHAMYGLNEFSDLSPEEFSKRHLRKVSAEKIRSHSHTRRKPSADETTSKPLLKLPAGILPDKVDWRTKGVVTPVRNQKLCGACWAFCTIETMESMLAIKNGTLLSLSVQEVIDCAGYGNQGCNGGDICSLAQWLKDNKIKVTKEKIYPLTLQDGTCKIQKAVSGVQVSDYSCSSLVRNEDEMRRLLAFHGPLAVAVNALTWQFYVGGVVQFHCSGDPFELNHAVQIVGYDMTAPTPHYIVRNSWGPAWGDKGYVKIAIGDNVCGIANDVISLDVT